MKPTRGNSSPRCHAASTNLDGRYVIRIYVLNFRTHLDRMQHCLEDIRQSVQEISGDT